MPVPEDCTFAIMCLGQEGFFFLAHYAEEVYLTPNSRDVSSLQWNVQRQCDSYTISYYSQWSCALDPHHWILVETRAEIATMQS